MYQLYIIIYIYSAVLIQLVQYIHFYINILYEIINRFLIYKRRLVKISLFFYILSVLLFINGIVLTVRGNVTVGLYIVFGLSICCFIWAKFHIQLWQLTSSGILLWLRRLVILGIAVYLIFMGLILSCSYTDVDYTEDAVIVLGAGVTNGKVSKTLQNRLDACIDYYHKNSDIYIAVSGGLTRLKDRTEAEAMAKYLIDNDIPEDVIIIEDKSQSTLENYRFTKQIFEDKKICHDSIVFVTNDFHIYRAKKYATYCGFENAHALSTRTDLFTFVPALIREVLGVIDMWVFKLK